MIAGALEIQLYASMARLQSDMNQAKGMVANTMAGIERAAASAKMALGAIGAGLSLAALAGQVRQAVDQLAKLDDMAQKTGSSVENLSRLSKVAAMTGQDFGAVDAALIKLSKGMATVDSETNKVHKSLDALGIKTTDVNGRQRDSASVMIEMTKKLSEYKDGSAKTALVIDGMGKSAADLLPFMNDVNEYLHKFTSESAASAASATKLLDMLGLMRVRAGELFSAFAVDLLPTLNRIGDAFANSGTSSMSFSSASRAVSIVLETLVVLGSEVAYVFSQTAIEISGLYKQLVALSEVSFSKIRKDGWTAAFADFNKIGDDMKKAAKVAREEHDKFITAVLGGQSKIDQALKLKPKTDGQDLNYLSGNEKKAVAEKISDYQRLTQEIAKLSAEEKKRLELGRELTPAEKRLADLMADLASGAQKMTEKEIPLAKALLATFEAQQKVRIEGEKLKKAREEIAQIVSKAGIDNAEYLANLELENSMVGKSALQQQLLRAEYQSTLTLKRQFAEIDKATKVVTDPAAIAKLQAESNARIEAIKAEARAKIEAKYAADVKDTFAVTKDKAVTQSFGAMLMPDEVARRTALAQADHAAALSRIADLGAIQEQIKIEADLKAKIQASDAVYDDKERQAAVGRAAREIEAEEKIRLFREENAARSVDGHFGERKKDEEEYIRSITNLLNDKYLNEQRGFEMTRGNAELSRQMITAEAEAMKAKLTFSGGQAQYDEANIKLQQQLFQIQLDSGDLDEQKKLGLTYQIDKRKRLLEFMALEREHALKGVGTGEEFVKIQEEILKLKKAISGVDIAEADKDRLKKDSDARQLAEAKILADTAQKTLSANVVQQFESDFHGSMLRLLEQGKTNWSAMMKGFANSFKVNVVDYIYKQFAKPFVFKAIMSLAGAIGANGIATAAGTAADAGAVGGISTTSWMSLFKTGYDIISGGFASMATSISTGVDVVAAAAYNNGLSGVGEALASNSTAIGTAGAYLGAGLAGVSIGTFIAGDKTLLGLNGMTSSSIGAALGAVFGGPIGAFLGGIAGGALNALFGMGPKQYGDSTVKGGFSGAGFEGGIATPWTQKGGLFRSNRSGEDMSALSDPAQQMLNGMVGKSGVAFARLITLSGDAARSVDGWSFAINRALKTEEDMTALFGEMADSMGTFVIPELEKFRAKGENLADTAVRMGDEYIITDSIFKMMGFTTAATGIASLGMRDNLIQLMGGIQQTSATMDSYYKNYFTAEEQHVNSLRQVTDQFKFLGVEVPKTRAEFRKIADTLVQDTTPAGQALFASFMKLNPAFAAVTQSTEEFSSAAVDMAKQLADATSNIVSLLDKLRGTNAGSKVAAQIAANNTMNDLRLAAPWIKTFDQLATITAEDASNYSLANQKLIAAALEAGITLKSFADEAAAKRKQDVMDAFAGLQRSVQAERDAITKTSAASVATINTSISKLSSLAGALRQSAAGINPMGRGQAQAQIATALLMARSMGIFPSADDLSFALQAVSEPSENLFRTFEDYKRDQILTGNDIEALGKLADSQLSIEEKTLKTLEDTQAQEMARLDAIVDKAQQQVDAMNGVNNSLLSLTDAMYKFSNALANQKNPTTDFQAGMGMSNVNGILTFADTASASAPIAASQASFDDLLARRKALRGFATGTNYVPQDMTARIHEGEAIIPKAYNRNNDSTNAALVNAIGSLQKEVVQLRKDNLAQLTAIALTNNKMEKVISRTESKGTTDNPLVTEAA